MLKIGLPGLHKIRRTGKKIGRRAFAFQKELYQLVRTDPTEPQKILLIIGCQRSGTTLMSETFGKDRNVKIYSEHSRLSTGDQVDHLRLNPLDSVERILGRDRFPLIVLKPLVETQNADKLLAYFQDAQAVWMYRHYRDVAASNLKRFGPGNGIKNLRYIVREDPHNWRSERIWPDVQELVKEYFSESMDPYDAAALFWYVRNRYYFDLRLDEHDRVMTCQYADFVSSPGATMRGIYQFVDRPYPGDAILDDIHVASIGKGEGVEISPEIDSLCDGLWLRLQRAHNGVGNP